MCIYYVIFYYIIRNPVMLASNWCGSPKYPGTSASICWESQGALEPNILIDIYTYIYIFFYLLIHNIQIYIYIML